MRADEHVVREPSRELRTLQWLQFAFFVTLLLATTPFLGGGRLVLRFAVAFGGSALVLIRLWGIGSGIYPTALSISALFPVLCLASVLWSWAISLTFMKAILMLGIFLTGAIAGFEMGRRGNSVSDVLMPWGATGILWLALTVLGVRSGVGFGQAGFRGGTGNENMFAAASAILAFPLSEYLLVSRWRRYRWVQALAHASPWFWAILIYLSRSRSGIAIYLIVSCTWWWATSSRRKLSWLVPFAIAACGLALAFGVKSVSTRVEDIVYKHPDDTSNDLFYSRRENWLASEAAITLVGPWGAGLGVAADQPFREEDITWTTSVGYGREHGSAWLALREQLGIPGQVLYVAMGMAVFASLVRSANAARKGRSGVSAPLLFGIAFGLYVASFVEAWTVAPGSAESGFFWAAVGQGAGVLSRSRRLIRIRIRPESGSADDVAFAHRG